MPLSQELKSKSPKELTSTLNRLRNELRELRFKVATRELKNVRKVRSVKRQIAQILTIINKKQS